MASEREYFGYSEGEVLDAFRSKKELVPNTPERLNSEKTTLESLKETSENLTEENTKCVRKLIASDLPEKSQTSDFTTEWKKEDFLPILDDDIEE